MKRFEEFQFGVTVPMITMYARISAWDMCAEPWDCVSYALAWLQVALLSGYSREDTMRAMHKGMHRAFGDSPHNVQSTIKAVYHMSYHMPARKCEILDTLQVWLRDRAVRRGSEYTSWVQPQEAVLHVYGTTRNNDYTALQVMKETCC